MGRKVKALIEVEVDAQEWRREYHLASEEEVENDLLNYLSAGGRP